MFCFFGKIWLLRFFQKKKRYVGYILFFVVLDSMLGKYAIERCEFEGMVCSHLVISTGHCSLVFMIHCTQIPGCCFRHNFYENTLSISNGFSHDTLKKYIHPKRNSSDTFPTPWTEYTMRIEGCALLVKDTLHANVF